MADVKPVKMQKRAAMGEKVTGMKKGGAVKGASNKPFPMTKKPEADKAGKQGFKRGGKC